MLLIPEQVDVSQRVVLAILSGQYRNLVLDVTEQLEWSDLVLTTSLVISLLQLLSGTRVKDTSNAAVDQSAVKGVVVVASDDGLRAGDQGIGVMNQVVGVVALLGSDGSPIDVGDEEASHNGEDDNSGE